MTRFRRRDPHQRFRELISIRLDRPLHLDDAWRLDVHLSRCQTCRAAEREYRDQRRLLRTLGPLLPPRDLRARTSAALDREVLRRGTRQSPADPSLGLARARSPRQRLLPSASLATSLAALGVATIFVISQVPLATLPDPTRLLPTPLSVPGLPLAFIGAGPQGLAIYRTSIDSVCPPPSFDCVREPESQAVHALSRPIEPSNLALSPSGRELAVSGRGGGFAIVMMPGQTADPSPTAPAASNRAPSRSPADRPTPSAVTVATLQPTTAPEDDALAVLAILDAVGVGAPPAWSSDGGVLAFSAMPGDRSHGPDLYIWRPGDEFAERVTSDQATYFASWSGGRIVASRVTVGIESAGPPTPAVDELGAADAGPSAPPARPSVGVSTVLIDPDTGAEEELHQVALWLPQVNLQGTHAVAWHGSLAWRGAEVIPDLGALYLVDWTQLDPPASVDQEAQPTPELDPVETMPTEPPIQPPTPLATRAPAPSATALLLTMPPIDEEGGRGAEDEAGDEEDDGSATDPGQPADSTTPTPAATPPTLELDPLDPAHDSTQRPVRDWEVRWSPDGMLIGVWTADVAGTSWGRLAVLDLASGELSGADRLSPTLARRSFTLGIDRVVWVGPSEGNPEGELRVTVWRADGYGVVRFNIPESSGVVTPF